MKRIWERIEAWLDRNAKEALRDLGAGVEPGALEELERDIGVTFPPDFRTSCQIHNGQRSADSPPLIEDRWCLLPIGGIKKNWRLMKEIWDEGTFSVEETNMRPDPQVKPAWWKPEWIPITGDGAGNSLCLDLDPTPQGAYGQIIWSDHMDERRECIAPSFEEFLRRFADDLAAGKYTVDGDGELEKK